MMTLRIKKYGFATVLFLFALLSFQVQASNYEKTKQKVKDKTDEFMQKPENHNKSCSDIATNVFNELNSRWFPPKGLDKVGYETAYNRCVSSRSLDDFEDYM